jgi:hypothetical protein
MERLLRPSAFPILEQLIPVQLPPFEYEFSRSLRHSTADTPIFDVDGNVCTCVPRMKMRRSMLPVIHPDADSEEARDFRAAVCARASPPPA